MTQAYRERLLVALVNPITPEMGADLIREFEDLAIHDIDAIEPIIDEMLAEVSSGTSATDTTVNT